MDGDWDILRGCYFAGCLDEQKVAVDPSLWTKADSPIAIGIKIELPSSVSREEWDRLIDVTPEQDDE